MEANCIKISWGGNQLKDLAFSIHLLISYTFICLSMSSVIFPKSCYTSYSVDFVAFILVACLALETYLGY